VQGGLEGRNISIYIYKEECPLCVCPYKLMHAHTFGDIDLKPSRVGGEFCQSGLRGGRPGERPSDRPRGPKMGVPRPLKMWGQRNGVPGGPRPCLEQRKPVATMSVYSAKSVGPEGPFSVGFCPINLKSF
jgi:hypothetical protein